MSLRWSNERKATDMGPPHWWLRLIGEWTDEPSSEFEDAAHQVEYRNTRIDALEQRVKVIEYRLGLDDADSPTKYRKPA